VLALHGGLKEKKRTERGRESLPRFKNWAKRKIGSLILIFAMRGVVGKKGKKANGQPLLRRSDKKAPPLILTDWCRRACCDEGKGKGGEKKKSRDSKLANPSSAGC